MNKPVLSYLILDFLRPEESKKCIESLYEYTRFPFKIIYLSNGGGYENQEYVLDYYWRGLIHQLILNKENSGLGYGTTDLFRFCDTSHAIYVQSDQFLRRTFAKDELDYLISLLDSTDNSKTIKSISLAGNNAQGQYSERAHLIRTDFYNSISDKPNFGAGPYHDGMWNEEYIQKYYKEHDFIHYIYPDLIFADNGCWAVRQNPDGTIIRHRTDTKQVWFNSVPKQRFIHPPLNDFEWELALQGKWVNGTVPVNAIKDSFRFWE